MIKALRLQWPTSCMGFCVPDTIYEKALNAPAVCISALPSWTFGNSRNENVVML